MLDGYCARSATESRSCSDSRLEEPGLTSTRWGRRRARSHDRRRRRGRRAHRLESSVQLGRRGDPRSADIAATSLWLGPVLAELQGLRVLGDRPDDIVPETVVASRSIGTAANERCSALEDLTTNPGGRLLDSGSMLSFGVTVLPDPPWQRLVGPTRHASASASSARPRLTWKNCAAVRPLASTGGPSA